MKVSDGVFLTGVRGMNHQYIVVEEEGKMAVKQTAGRDSLGDFAPKFAQLNDDVLFGEVWSQ